MAQERVQKILASVGLASRRKAEELIQEGQVTINGKRAKLGDKADLEEDAIKVKGKLLQRGSKEAPVYLAFHKPKGVISMLSDTEDRPTLADYLGKLPGRVFPVGRLDFNSEGLILLTNDGDAAERLQKTGGVARVYHVKVRGRPEASKIASLERGAKVGRKLVKPHAVRLAQELASKVVIEIVLTDPGAIDVKSYFEMKGFLVESIRRVAIGQIKLRELPPGQYRTLKASQIEAVVEHPELGLKEISDEGAPDEATGGFEYRRPAANQEAREAEHRAVQAAATREAAGGNKGAIVRKKTIIAPRGTASAATTRPARAPRPAMGKSGAFPRSNWGTGGGTRFGNGPSMNRGKPSFGARPRIGGKPGFSKSFGTSGSSGGPRPRFGAGIRRQEFDRKPFDRDASRPPQSQARVSSSGIRVRVRKAPPS